MFVLYLGISIGAIVFLQIQRRKFNDCVLISENLVRNQELEAAELLRGVVISVSMP